MILGPESESTFLVLELKSESGFLNFLTLQLESDSHEKRGLSISGFIGRVLYLHLSIAAYYLLVHF